MKIDLYFFRGVCGRILSLVFSEGVVEQVAEEEKQDFELQQRVYDMINFGYGVLDQYPKAQKFSLAQDTKKCMDQIMRLVIRANKRYYKKTTLEDLDIEVAALKVYVRMGHDRKYMSHGSYEEWSKRVRQVGAMVGGWIKSNQATPDASEDGDDEGEYFCSVCNAPIKRKVFDYSTKHFKKALCYKCQRAEKAKQ